MAGVVDSYLRREPRLQADINREPQKTSRLVTSLSAEDNAVSNGRRDKHSIADQVQTLRELLKHNNHCMAEPKLVPDLRVETSDQNHYLTENDMVYENLKR